MSLVEALAVRRLSYHQEAEIAMSGPKTLRGAEMPKPPEIQILREDQHPPRRDGDPTGWEIFKDRAVDLFIAIWPWFLGINGVMLYAIACYGIYRELMQ